MDQPNQIVQIIEALNPYLVPIVGVFVAYMTWKISQLEKNTNSIKDALVLATKALAAKEGAEQGRADAAAEQVVKDAALVKDAIITEQKVAAARVEGAALGGGGTGGQPQKGPVDVKIEGELTAKPKDKG